MPALDCVLHGVDKVYCSARSDAVLYSLAILLAPVWIFHLGLSIRERLEVGKVITVFTFQSLALFSCSQITSLSPALRFSSQLYPHSYPQTLFKLAEMSRAFLGRKKTGSRGWSPKNFLTSRVALKPMLNVSEPDGLIFVRRRIRRVLYLPGLWQHRGAAGTSSLRICSHEMTEIIINYVLLMFNSGALLAAKAFQAIIFVARLQGAKAACTCAVCNVAGNHHMHW